MIAYSGLLRILFAVIRHSFFVGKENNMTTNIKANVISTLLGSAFDDGIVVSISIPKLSAFDFPC